MRKLYFIEVFTDFRCLGFRGATQDYGAHFWVCFRQRPTVLEHGARGTPVLRGIPTAFMWNMVAGLDGGGPFQFLRN